MATKRDFTQHYRFLMGVACGVLVTGVVLPFAIGEREGGSKSVVGESSGTVGDNTGSGPGTRGPGTDQGSTATGDASAASDPSGNTVTTGGPSRPGETSPSDSGGTGGTTDQGVSADRIKLGIVLTDASNPLGMDTGSAGPQEQQDQWRALIAELNEHGGVAGRKIDPVFRVAAILDKDQQRATCIQLAKDDKVFAVLDAGGATSAELAPCYTVEHGLPLMGSGAVGIWDDAFANSQGLMFILQQRGSRQMRNFAAELAATGRVKGKICGIIGDGWQGASPKAGEMLQTELEKHGCKVVRRETMSADLATGSSQIPVAVQQMRASGANSVWFLVNPVYATQFVQNAEGQGYLPDYNLTDWLAGAIDFTLQNMPPGFFDRAAGVTSGRVGEGRANMPEIPESAACREIVERRTGRKLDRNSLGFGTPITACSELQLFAKAAGAVGPNLTRTAFAGAMSRLGAFTPGFQSPGTFAPGKPDLADGVRTLVARDSCKCWVAAGPFHQTG